MAFALSSFDGAPIRIARVSFTGDRSYELSVPARRTRALRARIVETMPAFGGGLLGLEGLMILRAEKGYIVVGKDTDGTTMPHDLGIAGPREQRKDEYIGKRSLFTPVANDKGRKQLVGLSCAPGEPPLPTGAHVVEGRGKARRSLGYVTSSYASPSLGAPGRAGPSGKRSRAHGRNGRRLSSRGGAARDDRIAGRARSGGKAAPCVR